MTAPPRSTERRSVLLVDDEDLVLKALRRTLSRLSDFEITTAPGGRDALAVLDECDVDVMVADVDMPGMSGLELVREVKHSHPSVSRILLTGRSSEQNVLDAINEGEVFRYLLKPWNNEELVGALSSAAELSVAMRQANAVRERGARARAYHEDLARTHAGLTDIATDDGLYVLSERSVAMSVHETRCAELRALIAPEPSRRAGGWRAAVRRVLGFLS